MGVNYIMDMSDSPQCLTEYLNYLSTIKNRSQLTVVNYYSDLRLFMKYLMITKNSNYKNIDFSEIKISEIDESLIRDANLNDALGFLNYTINERSNQAKARARKAVALRQFYKFLTNKKAWFKSNPMINLELPSPKNALPKHLSLNEAEQLLTNAFPEDYSAWTWQDFRDFCMIVIFINCGVRLSELVGLNVNDFILNKDLQNNTDYYSVKVLGKGNKERIVYLNDQCIAAWKNYKKYRDNIFKNENALFVSKQGKRISPRRVEQIIDKRIELCGLGGKGISVHKLRHTAATLMYQNGVDVRILKEVLGHENLNTTQIYTHVVNKQLRDAMNKNPISTRIEISEIDDKKE